MKIRWPTSLDPTAFKARVDPPSYLCFCLRVTRARRVSSDFNARFCAQSRTYIYRIALGVPDPYQLPLTERGLCWSLRNKWVMPVYTPHRSFTSSYPSSFSERSREDSSLMLRLVLQRAHWTLNAWIIHMSMIKNRDCESVLRQLT